MFKVSPILLKLWLVERIVPDYLMTSDPDMILQDPRDEDPRLKMSCGHAISKF